MHRIRTATLLCVALAVLFAGSVQALGPQTYAGYGASATNKRPAVVVQISGRLDGTTDHVPHQRCAGKLWSGTPKDGTGAFYQGTFDGVSDFCGQARLPLVEPDASGVDYHEDHTFVGTVRGCGTGTFRYTLDGIGRPFDPDKGYVPADEYWSVVDGTGTEDLTGIRSGINHRTAGVNTDGTVFAVFDPATNSVTCIPAQQHSGERGGPMRSVSTLPSVK